MPNTINMNGKFPEEVDDTFAALRQAEYQHDRGENHAQEFLCKDQHLHLVHS